MVVVLVVRVVRAVLRFVLQSLGGTLSKRALFRESSERTAGGTAFTEPPYSSVLVLVHAPGIGRYIAGPTRDVCSKRLAWLQANNIRSNTFPIRLFLENFIYKYLYLSGLQTYPGPIRELRLFVPCDFPGRILSYPDQLLTYFGTLGMFGG